jgi:hypothetical protein
VNGQGAGSVPIENFIKALTSQLDVAQETMRVKASVGYPLTFAVKDLSLELRAHVEVRDDVVRIRPAGPGDADASVLHLALTTITKPAIEENTRDTAVDADTPTIKEVLGDQISEDEQRRLEWAGIRNVSQLRDVHRGGGEQSLERISQLPVDRLRAALARASQPLVRSVERPGGDGLLRIRGLNLAGDGALDVLVGGERATVLQASDTELVVRPAAPLTAGTLELRSVAGDVTEAAFDLDGPAEAGES